MKLVFFLLTFFSVFWSNAVNAQTGFNPISNTQSIEQLLAKNAAGTQTIVSDFVQIKSMKMLNDKVTSKGKFFFKKQDKIRIEYTQPFSYILVMNGSSFAIKENGKISKINTRNSVMMQSVNRIMMDCLRGTIFNNKDFSVTAFNSAKEYLFRLSPLNAGMKGFFKEIEVYINKSDANVSKLIMVENGGDNTTMTFSNKKINTSVSDAIFVLH